MILSDGDISYLRKLGYLDVEPWDPGRVQPASYDLTLGGEYYDPQNASYHDFTQLHVYPNDFILLHTAETVTLGPKVGAQVCGKSTLARKGLIVESAGWVDPGFSGQLVLEVANLSPEKITLRHGMPIAQIIFMELRSPAQRPYGAERGSHYHGQTGPTPAYG
jgi:dCTP deaminase